MLNELQSNLFSINEKTFDKFALELFHYQAANVPVYKAYLGHIGYNMNDATSIGKIPFLPISFFKTHEVIANGLQAQLEFHSSSTSGTGISKHYIADPEIYTQSFTQAFERYFGAADRFCFLGLLPSYLERTHSSLVYMVDHFIKRSPFAQSGFYLYDHEALAATLKQNNEEQIPTIVFGVSFALLDFAEKYQLDLPHTILIETGGMKGRGEELVKPEVYARLRNSFPGSRICSEYGMTELLSQAYCERDGLYTPAPWMKVLTRKTDDPFVLEESGKTGAINIIDLANRYSCAFIATDDLGKSYPDGRFEIMGRMDFSDVRGCSLLVA